MLNILKTVGRKVRQSLTKTKSTDGSREKNSSNSEPYGTDTWDYKIGL